MALVNMQKPKPRKETKRSLNTKAIEPYYEKYPYGLKIDLGTDEINKLGIEIGNIRVGDKATIEAFAEVTRVEQSESADDMTGKMKEHNSLCLQITDLSVGKGESMKTNTLGSLKSKLTSEKSY